MENKRVPKIGETWLSNFGKLVTFFGRGTVLCQEQGHGPQFQVRGAIGERACGTCVTNARYGWTYISGPSAPRVPKIGETWATWTGACAMTFTDRATLDIWERFAVRDKWHYVSGPSDAPAIEVCAWPGCGLPQSFAGHNGCGKQLHMCDTVACHYFTGAPVSRITQAAVADELEKRAKDIPSVNIGKCANRSAADTEAARGGEAAISRADLANCCTMSDLRPNWPVPTHAGCSRSVACNVCVPPVKRVPWVDSLPWGWELPDAV